MKKQILLTAMALVIAAPCYAQLSSDTNVMKTETAVEKAARAQGFMSGGAADSSPQVIENSSVMMMAPEAPADAEAMPTLSPAPAAAAPAPAAFSYGNRPSLIKNGLPPGLVMNGPGTEAYKKKHRKKKRKAAVEQAAPAVPVEAVKEEAVAEPAPAEEPPLMPDANAIPPAQPPVEPVPADPDFPMPAPSPGLEAPAPAPDKPEAPLDPFAAPDP